MLAPDADGRQRHVRKLDEKLVNRAELQPGPRAGKDMAVVAGKHGGLQCKVVELVPSKEEGAPGEGDATSTSICPHAVCFPAPPALVPSCR